MPRTHNFNKNYAKDTEAITGSAVLAKLNEDRQLDQEKLENNLFKHTGDSTADKAKRRDFWQEYTASEAERSRKAMGLDVGELQRNADEAIYAGYMANQKKNAVEAVQACMVECHTLIENITDPMEKHDAVISNKQLVAMMRSAGKISNSEFARYVNAASGTTSADADSADAYTDPSVHYVIKPPSLINTYPTRSITTMDIKEMVKDESKESGISPTNFKTAGETVAFTEVSLGTKHEERKLYAFGAFFKLTDELLNDSNRAPFLPYNLARMRQEFMLALEQIIIYGSDVPAADAVKGFSEETGIQVRAGALAAGAWGKDHINAFETAITAIMTNADAYGIPNTILLHPTDYGQLLTSWEDNVGYIFSSPNTGVEGGAPVGDRIPRLFGVPINLSQAQNVNEMWVADTSDSYLALNGGNYQTTQGMTGDDLERRQETMRMMARITQFTRFAKKFYKITQTA